MYRFVKFSVHDYMDEYPHYEVNGFQGDSLEDIENASKQFARDMTHMYSGGPTNYIGIMSKEEVEAYIQECQEAGMDSKELETLNDLFKSSYYDEE